MALRSERLDIISICTGGYGLDLGIELAIPIARTVCMVEREAFAVAGLVSAMEAGLVAPAPIWSDARTFDGRTWRGAVDGFIGGIPCQPHSLAGRKQGQKDPRDLWSDARRIIVQSGAWFVVIENVAGMLSSGADEIAGAERVWRDLRKLGFEVEIGLFTASEVGASHQRERIFILGLADADRRYTTRRPTERSEASGRRPYNQPSGSGSGLAGRDSELDNAIGGRRTAGRDDHREDDRHQLGATGQHSLVHAERSERRADTIGRHQPDRKNGGRHQTTGRSGEPGEPLDDASIARSRPVSVQQGRQDEADSDTDRTGLFPPGPANLSGWRSVLASAPELEPAFRRVADGLASRLDIARVDRLRLLGNGVVPLEAAYAIRTLVTRLATRGSASAARLVRMMEVSE